MHSFLISTLLSLVPAPAITQDAAQDAVARDPGAKDVEIMRRLLVEAIEDTRANQYVRWHYDTPLTLRETDLGIDGAVLSTVLSGSGAVTHSRGFRAPGVGALFTLDVQIPAVEANAAPPEEEQQGEKNDAWERVKREVETGQKQEDETDPLLGSFYRQNPALVDTFASMNQRRWTLDPKAIEAATQAVLETLAAHGGRIRDMGAGDSFTVALHLSTSKQLTTPYTLDFEAGEPEDLETPWRSWVKVYGAGNAPPQRVVIQVPYSALTAIDGGGKAELERAARIHRY